MPHFQWQLCNPLLKLRDARILKQKIEDSACAIYNFCAEFLRILCKFCALFRKEEIQTYKCFALTLNDIRINYKIRTNNEKCRHLLHRPGT